MENEQPLIDDNVIELNWSSSKKERKIAYKDNIILTIIMWFLVIATGGVFGLAILWNIRIRYWFSLRCQENEATSFLMYSTTGEWVSVPVTQEYGIPFYEFETVRYVWNGNEYVGYHPNTKWTHHDILHSTNGLSGDGLNERVLVETGRNMINVPMNTALVDVIEAVFSPVQMYQYFCCLVWYVHDYQFFASMILISGVITTLLVVRRDREARDRIRQMASSSIEVNVLRNGKWNMVNSLDLVPGDLIQIPHTGFMVPCDLVLVSGSALVNESFMTGESVPVVKTQPEDTKLKIYDAEKDKNITIYGSTEVVMAAPVAGGPTDVLAVVARTGYRTSKGQLIKVILFKEPFSYDYEKESIYYAVLSTVVGLILFWFSLYIWHVFEIGVQTKEQILYAFESLVCMVPPFLPTIFNTVLLLSSESLTEVGIYTTSPSRIPIAGKVKTMCYDKTGTLTKNDLDVIGIVPADKMIGEFVSPLPVSDLHDADTLKSCMATCHSLASIDDFAVDMDNKPHYSGNSIDLKMFEATQWRYHNYSDKIPKPHVVSPNGQHIQILKRFEFDPALQRMSVLIQRDEGNYIYVKGSSEVLKEICDPASLPPDFKQIVRNFSRDGCYVLALGGKKAPDYSDSELSDLPRSSLESDLTFLGLLLLRNELKPDSAQSIYHMKKGRIRTVMITGDNIYTAIYIAKKSGIIEPSLPCFVGEVKKLKDGKEVIFKNSDQTKTVLDPLTLRVSKQGQHVETLKPESVGIAIDAETWRILTNDPQYDYFLTHQVQIYARMRPLDKQDVVVKFINDGQVTGMIGDGANDCAALGVAHFGVALSVAEASLIAPFTANSLSTMSAVDLVKEGRACLVNAFASFKFTIFYSLSETTAMFVSYHFGADLTQMEYIVCDFLFFFPVVFFMVKAKAADKLRGNPPTYKIFGPTTIWSLMTPLAVLWFVNGLSIYLLKNQSWFKPHPIGTVAVYQLPETTTLFLVNIFFLSAACITWSFGSKYRQPIWKNYGLMGSFLFEIIIIILVFTIPNRNETFRNWMEMVVIPEDFLGTLALVGVCSFFGMLIFEYIFIIGPVAKFFRRLTGRGRAKPNLPPDVSSI